MPAGLVGGRALWRAVADQVGSVSPTVVPIAAVAGIVVATVVVANLVAAIPGQAAARIKPAAALRAE